MITRIALFLKSAAVGAAIAASSAVPAIFVNQVAYDLRGPKVALIQADAPLSGVVTATVIDDVTSAVQMTVMLTDAGTVNDWTPGKFYYKADFSSLRNAGTYRVRATIAGTQVTSDAFEVDENALAKATIPSIVSYYFRQRATSAEEWAADSAVRVNDGSRTVDMRGGWADASGDVSKYFSHLAYANFVSPQQSPMVAWELADSYERIPALLTAEGVRDDMQAEALWGADYLYRALAPEGYFHMVVFSFFSKNANDRRIVGLLADSKTNNRWQASFRSGGGMAIAALARISRWKKNGTYFTSQNYLDGAKRAYAHLLVNNKAYDDDGKENIIDDYGALMASTELWIATDSALYRDEARRRMNNLAGRMTPEGYFRANDTNRPFWHAADAGLPIVALVRYLDKETDAASRATALGTIRKALEYELSVTHKVGNPFGYARQNFLYNGAVKEGFFIPQTNETGWWWQGENARLGSLAAAAILGGRLVYPADNGWGVKNELAEFATEQIAWILGRNPFGVSFMHGFGKNNPPVITALFGHGTNKGGIANGVTGKKGNGDGSGIDYKTEDDGNEWRWIEQWIPHSGWFLVAASAMAQSPVVRVHPNSHSRR
ncbi:MAG TPA: glycoside hydrolase family 9 protein [Vicinamibacterales bacterium]